MPHYVCFFFFFFFKQKTAYEISACLVGSEMCIRDRSKELIIEGNRAPYIVARGRKGGSNAAAAICNAMLYQIRR